MPSWPSSLPVPTDQSMQYAPLVDPVQTTQMETGAPKRRRRFTNVPLAFTATLILTSAQVDTLDTFIVTTLQDVDSFDWKDFRDGSAATYVFTKRPVYSMLAQGLWSASIELQKVS